MSTNPPTNPRATVDHLISIALGETTAPTEALAASLTALRLIHSHNMLSAPGGQQQQQPLPMPTNQHNNVRRPKPYKAARPYKEAPPGTPIAMESKFSGKCHQCQERYQIGDDIFWLSGTKNALCHDCGSNP